MAEYIYIAQAARELFKCKVGKTADLVQRLRQYNSMTGKSAENVYEYLFACEVEDMAAVENDFKAQFKGDRENPRREIYFYNEIKFAEYVKFLREHAMFVKEVFVKLAGKKEEVKIVERTTPSLEEQGKTRKDVMQEAKNRDNDEFYTRYEDVEKEIGMYPKEIWYNKVVFCNCDDAVDDEEKRSSAFAKYFINNFQVLGLKKLICTHYSKGWDIFSQGKKAYIAYVYIYEQGADGVLQKHKEYPKNYDGSFDHELSIKILNEEADIVCTNPPFSRARDYWKLLIGSGKQFLIISNITNVKNQPYMQYFIERKVWAGYNSVNKFLDPKKKIGGAPGHWYTNFPVENRRKAKNIKIVPLKNISDEHKYYDDKNVLVVHDNYIPKNYKKPFAVSVSPILCGLLEMGYQLVQNKEYVPYKDGERQFGHVLVQKV